jgi:ElaB/YqjD/DUF883 family membrane-anchored ribosome-binding protein
MENEAAHIREQMTETRTALTEKLETLEQEVLGSVQEAKAAVNETVHTVREAVQDTVATLKDSVQETVHSVKETLSVERQVRKHPWGMFAGSAALGFLGGRLLHRLQPVSVGNGRRAQAWSLSDSRPQPPPPPPRETQRLAPPPVPEESWLKRLGDQFAPEIEKIKGLAISTTLALVRDLVTPSIPPAISPRVREVFDRVATKLGGEPIRESILSTEEDRTSPQG